jgi:hypothetical protein
MTTITNPQTFTDDTWTSQGQTASGGAPIVIARAT